MNFQRKPEVVTAVQWHKLGDHPKVAYLPNSETGWLATESGGVAVKTGDWIVENLAGELLVVDNEKFNRLYKEVDL